MQTPQQHDGSPLEDHGTPQQEPASATVTRSVEIDAGVEQVWQALATDAGRQGWIEPDPNRILIVDREESPDRISWWWWSDVAPVTHVALRVVAIPAGTRVIVTETGPSSFPIARLGASFHPAWALA